MKTYEAIWLAGRNKITIENAAEHLNTSPRRVKQMVSYWGSRAGLLKRTLDKMDREFPSRDAYSAALHSAAEQLGITRRQLNRLLNKYELPRNAINSGDTRADREETHEKALEKWEMRSKAAVSFISGAETVETAAQYAEISPRQLYRWVKKLLAARGVEILDLRKMTLYQRRRLATQVEEGGGETT